MSNPNSPFFGYTYIVNSDTTEPTPVTLTGGNVVGPGTTPANVTRTPTGEGLYALKGDGSDAFGNGDVGVNPLNIDGFPAFNTGTTGTNSGYRVTAGDNGKLYVADYSDINGQLFQVEP